MMKVLMPSESAQVMYWLGTDVLLETRDREVSVKVARWRAPENAVLAHMAGSGPLQRELYELGIEARLAPFPFRPAMPDGVLPPMPRQFTVLTYIPDSRYVFYGGPLLLQLAKLYPGIRFHVIGGRGDWLTHHPDNVSFLGWLPDPHQVYADSSCVLRIPEHDSIGATAAEGLLFGRSVLYVNHLPHAVYVKRDVASISSVLDELTKLHRAGSLRPNEAAAAWARQEFDAGRRFRGLADILRELRKDRLT
jgi:glycosyltransferase involved in cell wall biosynthesis